MHGPYLFILARFIHVLAGVTWAGALIFVGWFVLPAVRGAGPAGGAVMQQLVRVQRLPAYLIALMALTLLSGFCLFYLDIVAFGAAWVHTGPGLTYSLGGAFAILAALYGVFVNMPAAKRMGVLGAAVQATGAPPSQEQAAELGRLQGRLTTAARVITILILLAVTCMGVARYIP
ncbi:MAG: hypothetical protein ABIQ10_09340 [Gemmatimonadaceae bacterium]